MSILTFLIVLICLLLVMIFFAPFVLSSRFARMEERQAASRTEELRVFIEDLKKEEEEENLSAGKHREQRSIESVHPTSEELDELAQMVLDMQSKPPRNPNNDHRD